MKRYVPWVDDGSEVRAVPFAPRYQVTSSGLVLYPFKGRTCVMQPGDVSGYGHLMVVLLVDGKRQMHKVHRLVLRSFGGEAPSDKPECRHLDGNPRNNSIHNLAWGSREDNGKDMARHGTSPTRKITPATASLIKQRLRGGAGVTALAQELGVGINTVSAIKAGRVWKHVA